MPLETDGTVLALLATAALLFFVVALIPRVDEMRDSYRKFAALSGLGIAYLVGLVLLGAVLAEGSSGAVETILAVGVGSFAVLGLALLGDVLDDWARLWAEPEFHTLTQAALVVAVVVVLALVGLVPP